MRKIVIILSGLMSHSGLAHPRPERGGGTGSSCRVEIHTKDTLDVFANGLRVATFSDQRFESHVPVQMKQVEAVGALVLNSGVQVQPDGAVSVNGVLTCDGLITPSITSLQPFLTVGVGTQPNVLTLHDNRADFYVPLHLTALKSHGQQIDLLSADGSVLGTLQDGGATVPHLTASTLTVTSLDCWKLIPSPL